MSELNEVKDDPELLRRMLLDLDTKDPLYKPTNYWKYFQSLTVAELNKYGLRDFRSRKIDTHLDAFGGTDTYIHAVPTQTGKMRIKGLMVIVRIFTKWLKKLGIEYKLACFLTEEFTEYLYRYVIRKFESVQLSLPKCSMSLHGNPEDQYTIENTHYSMIYLQQCSVIADAARHIPFSDSMVFCEIGGGIGRIAEVLGKLFPKATFIYIDIPPQLYIANQYLSAVFPERVIPYDKACELVKEKKGELLEKIQGKILILPPALLPEISSIKIDIFFNKASFQEMEPDVVENYLSQIKKMSPGYIYLDEIPEGIQWITTGQGGVKTPILEADYISYLQDKYYLDVSYPTDYFLTKTRYKSYIFQKKLN